jgi:D-alanyl-D-alanine carboxypeptidase (penicillin-binding protein 5/6)
MHKPFGPTMILAILCAWISGAASAFETKAQAAYVLDHDSGTVLLAKQAEVALPPASMSKLMTLFWPSKRSGMGACAGMSVCRSLPMP